MELEQIAPVLEKFVALVQASEKLSSTVYLLEARNKEISDIFLGDSSLRLEARGIIQRYIPIITSIVEGQVPPGTLNRVIPPGDIITLRLFLEHFASEAKIDPALVSLVQVALNTLSSFEGKTFGELFEEYSIPIKTLGSSH